MTGRALALPIGAALLLAVGVYLYIEVHASPTAPAAGHRPPTRAPVAAAPSEAPDPAPHPLPPRLPGEKRQPDADDRAAVAGTGEPAPSKPSGTPGIEAKLEGVMQQANRAYDRGDLDEAKMIASRVLTASPDNVRMLRIVVSSACIDGDSAVAQASFAKLPPADQEQMRARCNRYGISL
ncbi:MAG TPA: hypothetical protein VGC42_26105 [Kofleriaceae bacterium]